MKVELKQLHDRKVMKVVKFKELTKEQRRHALAYLIFPKRKKCGKVKDRGALMGANSEST